MQYVYNELQEVAPNGSVLFNPPPGCNCNRNGIIHRPGSGIFTLPGNRTYRVTFKANIALPEGGTGPIALALAIDGESVPVTAAIVTPAAAGDFFSVCVPYEFGVPCACCQNISVENVLPSAGATATPIQVQNAVIDIDQVRR